MAFSQKVKHKGEHAGNITEAVKPKSKKSERFNKQVHTRFGISMAVPVENFAEKYEFTKQPSVRSPLGRYDRYENDVFADPGQDVQHGKHKEAAMVRGTPSGFSCHGNEHKHGSLRTSGGLKGRAAHRIGARSKSKF